MVIWRQEPDACNFSCSSWRGYRTNEMNFRVSSSSQFWRTYGRVGLNWAFWVEEANKNMLQKDAATYTSWNSLHPVGLKIGPGNGPNTTIIHHLKHLQRAAKVWPWTTRAWTKASSIPSIRCCWRRPTLATGGWWQIDPWHRCWGYHVHYVRAMHGDMGHGHEHDTRITPTDI